MNKFKKERLKKVMQENAILFSDEGCSLGHLTIPATVTGLTITNSVITTGTQEEKPMCYENDKTTETMRYVTARLRDVCYAKEKAIELKYSPLYPKDRDEAILWMKEKNYHFKDMKDSAWSDPFMWGKEPIDYKAQGAEMEALDIAYQAAKDKVVILSDEEKRLETLREFEAYTIH